VQLDPAHEEAWHLLGELAKSEIRPKKAKQYFYQAYMVTLERAPVSYAEMAFLESLHVYFS
jgi:hypothetical protein